jgi:hypothetical protein
MPLILGANSVSGYTVKNSLRFNSGSSDELTRTFGTETSRRIFTFSCWIKKTNIATNQSIFFGDTAGTTNATQDSFYFGSSDSFIFGGWTSGFFTSTMLFRDVSAWYHIVVGVDSTQATSANRIKFYVNGVEQAYTSGAGYPAQNADFGITKSGNHSFFGNDGQSGRGNGYLAEAYLIDGQQLTPSSFGETDTLSGIWKPKAYTGTYGNNGFYLQFKNSASLGTDSSGNGNTFTVNNLTSVDQSTDTPTNNFATMNPLNIPTTNAPTFTEGNLQTAITSTGYYGGNSSIMASAGKWYAEFKMTAASITGNFMMGVDNAMLVTARNNVFAGSSSSPTGYSIYGGDGYLYNNSTNIPYGTSYTTNDIISIALDLDNNKLYLAKNGTWMNSGVPTSGATGTGAISITASSSTIDGGYTFSIGDGGSAYTATVQANFGSPPYAANSYADGAGYGNFSYAVPSGYYSLNTKNLATYG